MRVLELRTDVVHIVGHAAQDGVGNGFGAVATLAFVAVELLDPLQVDDRHHANEQVRVLGNVDFRGDHRTVQAFVKQQVGVGGHIFPGGEGAWVLLVGGGFVGVVQVFAAFAGAGFSVVAKQRFQLSKQVVRGTKMAEVFVTSGLGFGRLELHLFAVKTVKAVAFDDRGADAFATKNIGKGARDGRGSGTAGAGDGDDGVAC